MYDANPGEIDFSSYRELTVYTSASCSRSRNPVSDAEE